MVITIPYEPRTWARQFHASAKRWLALVLHRRAGKTTAVLNHLQRDCIRNPEAQYAYIGPTYRQSKRVAWDIAKRISRDIPGVLYNESELTVRYQRLNDRNKFIGLGMLGGGGALIFWGVREKSNPSIAVSVEKRNGLFYRKTW